MRQTEILRLAYIAQVQIWEKEKEYLEASPESVLSQGRERIASERLEEIRGLWLQAEQEEKSKE